MLEAHGDDTFLLVVDVELLGSINGFAIAHLAAERWPLMAVVVYSGRTKPTTADMPRDAVFLELPFSPKDLFASARKALAARIRRSLPAAS